MRKFTEEERLEKIYTTVRKCADDIMDRSFDFYDDVVQDSVIEIFGRNHYVSSYAVRETVERKYKRYLKEKKEEDNTIENISYKNMENSIFIADLENELCSKLETLTERETYVLQLRFYDDLTLKEVGELIGVHSERVRQIEAKALRKMRHPSRSRALSIYLDLY